jgi:hypothetical protein
MPPNDNAPRPELVEEPRVALLCPDCGADLSAALAGQNVRHDCAIKDSLPGHRWLCQHSDLHHFLDAHGDDGMFCARCNEYCNDARRHGRCKWMASLF